MKSVTLELKDGDYGDCDGVANSIVVDPSGPGIATAPAPQVATMAGVAAASLGWRASRGKWGHT